MVEDERIAADIRRAAWAEGGDRPGLRLRPLGRRVGGAWMCQQCDGDGVVIRYVNQRCQQEPMKCPRCNGEGLDPSMFEGGRNG